MSVLLIGLADGQVICMPLCSFYSKNNIVIPLHQLISFPSSPLTHVSVVELECEGERRLGNLRGAARRT